MRFRLLGVLCVIGAAVAIVAYKHKAARPAVGDQPGRRLPGPPVTLPASAAITPSIDVAAAIPMGKRRCLGEVPLKIGRPHRAARRGGCGIEREAARLRYAIRVVPLIMGLHLLDWIRLPLSKVVTLSTDRLKVAGASGAGFFYRL